MCGKRDYCLWGSVQFFWYRELWRRPTSELHPVEAQAKCNPAVASELALRRVRAEGRCLYNPFPITSVFQLFLGQSFTTPGVYVKTASFSLSDQAADSPPGWGDGFGGYAKRTASRYGQFVTHRAPWQDLGNGLLGYEASLQSLPSARGFGRARGNTLLHGTS